MEKVEREEKVEQESNLKAEKLDTEVCLHTSDLIVLIHMQQIISPNHEQRNI